MDRKIFLLVILIELSIYLISDIIEVIVCS